jgi:iron complex outermembrane recepter protein
MLHEGAGTRQVITTKIKIPNSGEEEKMEKSVTIFKYCSVSVAIGVASVMIGGTAFAQTAEDNSDDSIKEIIVTAQKRSESVTDVPISITVLSEQELQDRTFSRFVDVAATTPNFLFQRQSTTNSSIAIRGVASELRNAGLGSATALVVDDVVIERNVALDNVLNDVASFEVLRGPQGTFFGRNTIAGLINTKTVRPTFDLSGSFDATYGNNDYIQVRGYISGPILPDKLAVKIAGAIRQRDGFMFNQFLGKDVNNENTRSVRGQLLFTPNDRSEFLLSVDYTRDKANDQVQDIELGGAGGNFTLYGVPRLPPPPAPQPPLIPGRFVDGSDSIVFQDVDNTLRRKLGGIALRARFDLGIHSITSVTAYRGFEISTLGDGDFSPVDAISVKLGEKQRQFSQELRLASEDGGAFNYLLGAFYMRQTLETDFSVRFGRGQLLQFPPTVGPPGGPQTVLAPLFGTPGNPNQESGTVDSRLVDQSLAVFASGSYDFTEKLSISGGIRYSTDTKKANYGQTRLGNVVAILGVFGQFAPFNLSNSSGAFSGDISLNYKPTEDSLIYAKFARGYRSGGMNLGIQGGAPDFNNPANRSTLQFSPEFIKQYEVGFKVEALDRRLRFNAAAFYLDYSDKQEATFETVGPVTVSVIRNAGAATIKGFEADVVFIPVKNVSINAAIGYADAKYDDFASCQNIAPPGSPPSFRNCAGNRLLLSSKWTGTAGIQATPQLSENLSLFARFDVTYRGNYFTDAVNAPLALTKGSTLVNGRIGLQSKDGWGVFLWSRNLLDKEYFARRQVNNTDPVVLLGEPRTYGLELRYRF